MAIGLVYHSIAVITMMIMIGALLTRTFHFNEDTRNVFISLIVNVGMPCIILSSIFQVEIDGGLLKKMLFVFVLSVFVNVVGIGLGYLFAVLFHKNVNRTKELALLSGLGNTGFIGIPLCAVLLGPEGALYAAMFDAGVDLTLWTLGAFMLQKDRRIGLGMLRTMINTPIIAIVAGLGMAAVRFRPPEVLVDLIDRLAAIAAPLAMFYIGILVMTLFRKRAEGSLGQKKATLWLPVSVKLIILPVFAAMLGKGLALDATMLQTVMIQSMMPTLTLASILFAKYSADEEMGAVTTVCSTLLALFTIPLMIYALNAWVVGG